LRKQVSPEAAFGEVLKQLRREQGLTQEELGEAAGCHRAHVSFMERGLKSPTLNMIYQVAEAFGITVPALIERVDEVRRANS
jgi:transcriptional regulator with XRE-family HTH domain